MLKYLLATVFLSALALCGSETVRDSGPELPDAWNSISVSPDGQVRTPDGKETLLVTSGHDADELRWPPFLIYLSPSDAVRPGTEVTIRCYAKATRPLRTDWRVTRDAPNATPYSKTVRFTIGTEWHELVFRERLFDALPDSVIALPRMLFPDIRKGDKVYLGPLSVSMASPEKNAAAPPPAGSVAPVKVSQPGSWKVIDVSDLYIRPGSALDFRNITDRAPAGSCGRLTVDENGMLCFEKRPGVPVRFFSVQLMPGSLPAWSKREIREYAAALARQGYNLVRFHFLDQMLQGSGRAPALKNPSAGEYVLPQAKEEIRFLPRSLDNFHYLVAELRKNGVYINLDAMTSYIGYDNGRNGARDKKGAFMTKIQMFVNPMFRRNWKAGVDALFSAVNPYTGLSLKEDPAVVLVSCLNEQEVLTSYRDYSAPFHPAWIRFLKGKYGTYENLFKAWGGKCGDAPIPEAGSFEKLPGITHKVAAGRSCAGKDMTECVGAMESEMTEFYLKTIREVGYPGLVTNWNMRTRLVSVPARSKLPAISMNGYHCHPQNGIGAPGSTVENFSSVERVGNSFKHQALARFTDRPFFNTEFGFCFWNPFRHEQGLVFGAGAALQGWSSITCHAGQVQKSGGVLTPFRAGEDPVIRAAEVVEAFAYLRGDVQTSPHLVEIPLSDGFIFDGRAMQGLSDELSRIWTLCRVGISYGPRKGAVKPDLTVRADRTVRLGGSDMFTSVENSVDTAQIRPVVAELRSAGVLPAGNLTDPGKGIYQSDTGEITLSTDGVLKVVTPRLAGGTVKKDGAYELGAVRVKSCSVPAALSVISLAADESIPQAARLLIVFSTDALNNGMEFRDPGRRELKKSGGMPILWRTGKAVLSIDAPGLAGTPKLYALKLNGERAAELPATCRAGRIEVEIDTGSLAAPTPFFELVTGR